MIIQRRPSLVKVTGSCRCTRCRQILHSHHKGRDVFQVHWCCCRPSVGWLMKMTALSLALLPFLSFSFIWLK